ncbi:ABC transporter substrate-binding protein [Pseudofrankia sp. BMG5.36]|uniref:ABC transporter substrate-binding protein n=1 Tax=Pseudofrankia sp. BMG5.36 TaxID=1834512 RepID=UPI0012FF6E26|nr:ABC transporter substrate-binding protein [Pseudofrankia sp. BMG5.36]
MAVSGTLLSLCIVGCSNANNTSVAATCNAPGVTREQVKIGFVLSNSGMAAGILQAVRSGVDARLGVANAAGGVHGREIVYGWQDDESDPRINLKVSSDLVDNQNVFGLLEMTGAVGGSAEYLNRQGVPVVGRAIEPVWSEYRNMFSYANPVSRNAVSTFGTFAKSLGGTNAALVSIHAIEASRTLSDQLAQSLTSAGIEVVADLDYTPGASSPERVGQTIRDSQADVLLVTLAPQDAAAVRVGAVSAGSTPKVTLLPVGYDQKVLDQFGPGLAGTYVFLDMKPFEMDTPAHEVYRDAMARYAPELQPAEQDIALTSYITTDLLVRGLQEAGQCLTRDAFITNLRAVKDYDATGLLAAPVDLDASFGKPSTCYIFMRINPTGSSFDVVTPEPVCGNVLP